MLSVQSFTLLIGCGVAKSQAAGRPRSLWLQTTFYASRNDAHRIPPAQTPADAPQPCERCGVVPESVIEIVEVVVESQAAG